MEHGALGLKVGNSVLLLDFGLLQLFDHACFHLVEFVQFLLVLDLGELGGVADSHVGNLDLSQVLILIVLRLVGRLFARLVALLHSHLLNLQSALPFHINLIVMLPRAYLHLIPALKMVLMNLLLVTLNVFLDFLLLLDILGPFILPRLFNTVQMGIFVHLVQRPALPHLVSKRCFPIGNTDLPVKMILFSFKLSQAILHQKFLLLTLFEDQFFLEFARCW